MNFLIETLDVYILYYATETKLRCWIRSYLQVIAEKEKLLGYKYAPDCTYTDSYDARYLNSFSFYGHEFANKINLTAFGRIVTVRHMVY